MDELSLGHFCVLFSLASGFTARVEGLEEGLTCSPEAEGGSKLFLAPTYYFSKCSVAKHQNIKLSIQMHIPQAHNTQHIFCE